MLLDRSGGIMKSFKGGLFFILGSALAIYIVGVLVGLIGG